MANRQTSSTSASAKSARARAAASATPSAERDANFDVISVLYHALKGAAASSRYVEDARDADDEELIEFLEETQAEYVARAAKAKVLLGARLAGEEEVGEEEEEEEEDAEEEEEEDEDEE